MGAGRAEAVPRRVERARSSRTTSPASTTRSGRAGPARPRRCCRWSIPTGRRSPGRASLTRRDADGSAGGDPGGAEAAARRPGPQLRALPLPGRARAAGTRPRSTCWRPRPRPRRSGARRCGWSAAPTSRARRCAAATSTTAYRLAAQSFGDEGADYADAEWLAGFIALTRMDDPDAGRRAFPALPVGGLHPDQPRARRLLARASPHERAGDPAAAQRGVPGRRASTRPASTASSPPSAPAIAPDARLAGSGVPDWKARGLHALLGGAGGAAPATPPATTARAAQFLRHAAERQPPETRAALAQMAIDLGRPAHRHPHRQGRGRRGHRAAEPVLSAAPDRRGSAGRCRPSSPWRSPGRNPSSNPRRSAAPGRAG